MKVLMKRLFGTAAALSLLGLLGAALPAKSANVVTTDQVRAELVAQAPDGIAAGKPLWLGLKIEHRPHWHTYWKNPGDSGLPTQLEWTLPAGLQAGDIQWPTPKKLPVGPLLNYGYEGTLLLPVAVTVPAGFDGRAVDVKLRADWLVCNDVCIPQGGDFSLSLPAQSAIAGNAALFNTTQAALPQDWKDSGAQAHVTADALVVKLDRLPAGWQGKDLQLFPETAGVIDNAAQAAAQWQGDAWQIKMPLSPQRSESPQQMDAVIAAAGQAAGVRVSFAVTGTWPQAGESTTTAAEAAPATAATPAPSAPAAAALSLAPALLFALFGGMLLNLMPCVFPVLSLKVLGFASHAHDHRALIAGGVAYTAGVVLSFVALAGLLLALRAGGEQIGWGFQLQSPGFVAVLAALFTLIGLNLAGVFEVGSVLPSSLASLQARHPLVDSALTGVLAVAIASPCTAPFMGASLGVAATLPTVQALSVFAALGLGMALPYLLASAWPAVARLLPRPGVWMVRFKVLMAFPMFATVVWLVWVLGQQVGIDGATALLGLLVALAFAAWAFGTPGMGRAARTGFGAVAALLLGTAVAWAVPALKEPAPSTAQAANTPAGWEPWSEARVAELTAQGRPVFVDFTAAWCVTCQFNKRSTLKDAALLADFDARKVVLLRADWTRRDPSITAALAKLGRNGVPVYAIYKPGAPAPELLPEVLTVSTVRDALGKL